MLTELDVVHEEDLEETMMTDRITNTLINSLEYKRAEMEREFLV